MVYGNNLDAYGIVQALLDVGVPPLKLLLALPNASTPFCRDPVLLEHLEAAMTESGVKVWTDLTLTGWVVTDEEKLTGIRLLMGDTDYEVPCQALIYVDEKQVDTQAFRGEGCGVIIELLPLTALFLAMNDACLVFDRRLVITADHATNDPLIFAAGPVTKFSRRYTADQW